MRLELGRRLSLREPGVDLFGLFTAHDVTALETGVARVRDLHFVDYSTVLNAPVGALDESVLVDAREARQRRDEADVRAFRRLNRADAAVVRGVNVANLEARALARKAGPALAPKDAACA